MDSASALRDLALQATEDPSVLDTLTEDQIHEVRRGINPAGGVVSAGNQAYVNLSVVNWSDNARIKQVMMSFIGYFSRMISEYEPEEEADAIRDKYKEKLANAKTNDERKKLNHELEAEIKIIRDIHRKIARKVFDRNFEYDPDLHVRKAKSEGLTDKERAALHKKIQEQLQEDKKKTAEAALQKDTSFNTLKKIVLAANTNIVQAEQACRNAAKALVDPALDRDDKITLVLKNAGALKKLKDNIGTVAGPLSAADCIDAVKYQPPADVFHHFGRYMANHYEFLNDLCVAFFNEKPDIEFMVTVYSTHDSEKDAQNFCKQHAREFRQQVFTVSSGAPTLLGPFKQNRERLAFYTQDTEVLARMAEQSEMDAKLGKDLLEKRTQIKKKQNIRQVGPDAKGLKNYKAFETGDGSTNVAAQGVKKIISNERMAELEAEARQQTNVDLAKLASIAETVTGMTLEDNVRETAAKTYERSKKQDEANKRREHPTDDGESVTGAAASASAAAAASASIPELKPGEPVPDINVGGGARPTGAALEALQRNAAMTQKYGIYNIESAYKEKPVDDDEFEKMRRTGNYVVNDVGGDELPDDAICSEVFVPVENEDGETVLVKKMLYTQAESPLHLEKDSPFNTKYQPKRNEGASIGSNVVLRTVKDRDGNERDVHDSK